MEGRHRLADSRHAHAASLRGRREPTEPYSLAYRLGHDSTLRGNLVILPAHRETPGHPGTRRFASLTRAQVADRFEYEDGGSSSIVDRSTSLPPIHITNQPGNGRSCGEKGCRRWRGYT